jgi:hypothetical protein
VPDGIETIRELLTGFNSLAMNVGISPISFQNQGFQTPQTPRLKTPGEFSQELMQQSMQQTDATTRAIQQVRMSPGPGILGLSPGNISTGAGIGAGSAYSAQYQARMQDIESRYISPHQAQQFAQGGHQTPFINMPSPIFQTTPSMGIFRPNLTLPPPIPLAREAPLVSTPFSPPLPTPFFQSPTQMAYQQRALADERMFAGAMAAAPTAANLAVGGATTAAGWGLGGRIGQALGGARGGAIGRLGGLVGGAALGFGVLGGLAEQGMTEGITNPIVQRRAFGNQLEQISQQFVTGGTDLNQITGRGLATQSAVRLAGQLQQDVEGGQTAGFNMRDMMRLTGMAAQGGMLDMAQNSEQIRSQMRNVAKGLRAFMEIAQEPDVRRAMQQMGTMQAMGLTIPESNIAMRNAQTFARMAGTTVSALQGQAGMPGAMTFQQMGMTAGLGMQVGQAAAGLSRQAVAGGAFTPGQLAMAGGQAGLTQTLTEAGAAGLGVNFPLMSMLRRGGQGTLEIDPERARQVMRGELTLSQQAQLGAENIQRLGGERAISELSTRLNELRDELGRTLGPQGTTMYTMRQAVNVMRDIPGLTFGGALRQLGLTPQQARSMEVMGQSSQFWQNLQQQHEVNIRQIRDEEAQRRDRMRETSELSNRVSRWWNQRGWLDRPGEMVRGAGQAISEWWTDRGAAEQAAQRGATYVGRSRMLGVEDRRQQEAIDRFVRTGGQARFAQRAQGALGGIGARGAQPTGGEIAGSAWNTALGIGTGVASLLGGPIAGIGAGLLAGQVESTIPMESQYVAALQARGGIAGALAGATPSLANLIGAISPTDAARADYEARQAAETGSLMRQGQQMSTQTVRQVQKELSTAHKEYARAIGADTGRTRKVDMQGRMVQAAISAFRDNSSMWGDKATMASTLKKRVIEARVHAGEDRRLAERYVNDMWDKGLGQTILRQAMNEAPEDVEAGIAQALDAQGYLGMVAGKNLAEVQEKLEDLEEKTKTQLGFYEGFDATDRAWKEFAQMATTSDEDTMLLMQAQALNQSGQKKEGRKIEDALLTRLGRKKLQDLRELLGERVKAMSDDQREMLIRSGKQTAKLSPEKMREQMEKVRSTLTGTRGTLQIAQGAARLREQGITAFGALMRGGMGEEGALATLQELTTKPGQLEDLAKQSPEIANIVKEFRAAGTDQGKRTAAAQRLLAAVQQRGRGRTGGEFGGKGVGSPEEQREREQMGVAESIWETIKSRAKKAILGEEPGGDLAGAASELRDVTKDLRDTVQAARLALKM